MDIVEARMNVVGFSSVNQVNGGSYVYCNKIERLSERKGDNQPDVVVKELFGRTAHFGLCALFSRSKRTRFGSADGFENENL
jgi:HAE1 family hydrophobic/amphiphilic exporter-1